jgi:hypothetical protein
MNTKYLIPLCAAAALMAACGQRESNPSMGGDSAGPSDAPSTETAPPAAGDTATTPGGTAGDATTTPGTTSTPAQNPPADSPTEPPPTSN